LRDSQHCSFCSDFISDGNKECEERAERGRDRADSLQLMLRQLVARTCGFQALSLGCQGNENPATKSRGGHDRSWEKGILDSGEL
jgi:hypothetical protein